MNKKVTQVESGRSIKVKELSNNSGNSEDNRE